MMMGWYVRLFFCGWDNHVGFFIVLILHTCYISFIVFVHVELSWPWCMAVKVYCWILIVGILLRTFASILIKEVGLSFCVFISSSPGLGQKANTGFKKDSGSTSSLFVLWSSLKYVCISSWQMPWNPARNIPEVLVIGRLLLLHQCHCLLQIFLVFKNYPLENEYPQSGSS